MMSPVNATSCTCSEQTTLAIVFDFAEAREVRVRDLSNGESVELTG
jgi:hypothetical protein